MSPRPEYRSYQFAGHDENALCLGMGASRRILIIPPLFDEMNRCRRMLVQAMRGLADRGVGALLIDLPGCNESPAALADQSLSTWREAVTAAAAQLEATHIAALRGGALVDDGAPHLPHWRLAPAKGSSLLKTMIRTRIGSAARAAAECLWRRSASHEPSGRSSTWTGVGPEESVRIRHSRSALPADALRHRA